MGVRNSVGVEDACGVTNAGEVGVSVCFGADGMTGAPAGVSVSFAAANGSSRTGLPPTGVGVWYCPHKEALPVHDARSREIRKRGMKTRFTGCIIPVASRNMSLFNCSSFFGLP